MKNWINPNHRLPVHHGAQASNVDNGTRSGRWNNGERPTIHTFDRAADIDYLLLQAQAGTIGPSVGRTFHLEQRRSRRCVLMDANESFADADLHHFCANCGPAVGSTSGSVKNFMGQIDGRDERPGRCRRLRLRGRRSPTITSWGGDHR